MKKVLAAACLLAFSTAYAAQEPEAVFNRACTMCHSGQLYGRVTISEHEYFYVRAQDILVHSDVFHAYQKKDFSGCSMQMYAG